MSLPYKCTVRAGTHSKVLGTKYPETHGENLRSDTKTDNNITVDYKEWI